MSRPVACAACALLFCFAPARSARGARAAQTNSVADAQRLFDAGQYSQAADMLSAVAAKSPDDSQALLLLGRCYYELGDFPRAITSLERRVELAPKDSESHDWLGRAYGRKAEQTMMFSAYTLARKTRHEFETAVQLDPSNLEAQRDLIRFDMNAPSLVGGGDDRALHEIDDLAKIDPVESDLARAEFYSTKKQFDQADQLYQKILTAPKSVGVCLEAADFYRDRGDAAHMAAAVAAAVKIDPSDRRLAYYRGVADVMSGQRPAEAEQLLRAYLSSTPENSDMPSHASALEWLGTLYEKEGRNSEAAQEYKACLDLDPRNRAARDGLRRVAKE
ncbi:MAG: tetratricopeptide repeat protein [Candidatus Acidiferrales bacterium]